jgi:hypothetical protein
LRNEELQSKVIDFLRFPLIILWFIGCWFSLIGTHGLSIATLFFFTLGAWFSINKRNLVEEFGKVKKISFYFYPLLVIIDLLTKGSNYNYLVHHLGILWGIAFFSIW